jgi:16S rRNA (uracil1498-N3)-methyltransferase
MGRLSRIMRRYWVDKEKIHEKLVSLDGELFHHLTDVCRLDIGDKFELLTGEHRAFLVEMKERTKKQAIAEIIEERKIAPLPHPFIRLAISVPRFQKMDFIIEKCVELGVKSIHPFISDFSYVRKLEANLLDRLPRWDRIVKSATQQSGRGDLMEIAKPVNLQDILLSINRNPNARGLFSYEGEAALGLKTAIEQIKKNNPKEIWVIVGSEGGFSNQEVQIFETHHLEPVTMGEQVLRVETACMALISVIKYEFAITGG